MDNLEQLVHDANKLRLDYMREYDSGSVVQGKKLELRYLDIRRKVLAEVDETISRQKSIPMREIEERVKNKPKVKRIETGIESLDYELVSDEMKRSGTRGGMSLGNFVQIAGGRGSGKSSIMMKMITGFSHYESVCWFDFEMGEDRVVKKLRDFDYDSGKLLYYSASRQLDDIIDEIKFLSASGVRHFVIDSAMKIGVKDADRYDRFSKISSMMAEMTSSLTINIYMINQISQSSDSEGRLYIKHGNDAEYDADFIFYIVKPTVKGTEGEKIVDEDNRIMICSKNRQDERLFEVIIPKNQIIKPKPYVVEYTEEQMNG